MIPTVCEMLMRLPCKSPRAIMCMHIFLSLSFAPCHTRISNVCILRIKWLIANFFFFFYISLSINGHLLYNNNKKCTHHFCVLVVQDDVDKETKAILCLFLCTFSFAIVLYDTFLTLSLND